MTIDIKVPELGESIQEVQIVQWLKAEGDRVEKDEDLVEIDSEKATVQVPSPESGTLAEIVKPDGEFCEVGDVIARLDPSGEASESLDKERREEDEENGDEEGKEERKKRVEREEVGAESASEEKRAGDRDGDGRAREAESGDSGVKVMPAARRVLAEHGLAAEEVEATGPGGRLLKEDVLRHVEREDRKREEPEAPAEEVEEPEGEASPVAADRREEVVPMSVIRRHIARRLVEAQQQAALLTTFNECDMSAVIELRKRHRDRFHEKHGVKLGFMSFFVKAVVEALKQFPQLNAELREKNIVYRNYYDVGIAIGGGKGLVVPVLRGAERMSFAEVEKTIADFAARAADGRLEPEELEGGTFTISNGGIYGSMLSTPIVNPPQSGILGLHAIQDRPVAREGNVVIRPMMYLALTYDHRIVDGREAVTFLRTVKDLIEEPARMILEI